ncbi:MAG: hypothetical protein QF594_02610 [Dehalococcoidales bacterium]|nr:hypothetical protein [Dehalococcoidales bacterium]
MPGQLYQDTDIEVPCSCPNFGRLTVARLGSRVPPMTLLSPATLRLLYHAC